METKQKRMLDVVIVMFLILVVATVISVIPFQVVDPDNGTIPSLTPLPWDPGYTVLPTTPVLQPITVGVDGSIPLTWSAVEGATSYQVYMKKGFEAWESKILVISTATTIKGLANGDYSFKVRGYHSVGYSEFSNVRSVTVAMPVLPEAPVLNDIAPYPNTNGEIYLGWNSVAGAESYQIQMSIDSGGFFPIKTTIGIEYTHSVSINGNYKFKVRAYNSVGYSWYSEIKSVIVSIPNVPITPTLNNLTSEVIGETFGVSLTWNDINCDGYNVYRSFNDGDYILIKANLFSTTYYDILTESGLYAYKVSAVNIYGESTMSNPMSITTTRNGGVEPPTDYIMLYILLGGLGVLAISTAIILVKRRKR